MLYLKSLPLPRDDDPGGTKIARLDRQGRLTRRARSPSRRPFTFPAELSSQIYYPTCHQFTARNTPLSTTDLRCSPAISTKASPTLSMRLESRLTLPPKSPPSKQSLTNNSGPSLSLPGQALVGKRYTIYKPTNVSILRTKSLVSMDGLPLLKLLSLILYDLAFWFMRGWGKEFC